jgi:citrate lyase subunit beta/citryl-CoA lyase
LYYLGSRADVLEKTRKLHADAVVLDLEDAVAPTSKDVARDIVVREVSKGGFGLKRVAIRINPLNTPWGNADLERAATSGTILLSHETIYS